ncbi:BamA/TamA family outer membrane protein [Altererythrobacter endophyticus]|uniref:BamA/TamA family outer membrane protein n=2 Tax=Altericroceibacterium endophyticum TaxID=1808508 RepID=A0A6I4T6E7_9SPHN|nr:BamA/TamA family outer membrane protein [Altericroceibacterium endophyticum]
MLAVPVMAQDYDAPASLEDLIPDEAVDNPEDWASQGVSDGTVEAEDLPPEVDPDAPLAEMPSLTVPWPNDTELPKLAPLSPDTSIQFADFGDDMPRRRDADVETLSDELTLAFPSDDDLLAEREEFVKRFTSLSTILELDDDDSEARLAAQAKEDEKLLTRLLDIYGYYDGQIFRSANAAAGGDGTGQSGPKIRFDILPGVQYKFGAIDLGSLSDATADYDMLRGRFGIQTGDPLLSDVIEEERDDLDRALGENGYPFAHMDEPELLIDHAREEGDLSLLVQPGGKYAFGTVTSNLPDFLSGQHLARVARFDPGQTYQRSLQDDLRRAIMATGLVSSATLTPVEREAPTQGAPGTVDIAVELAKAPLRTIAGSIGYGTGEGFRAQASWEHRNLFPPEGMLRLRGIAGTREQLAGVTFRRNNVKGRDRILTLDAFATTKDFEAYEAKTASLVGTYERQSTLLFQKPLGWSIGAELIATAERERDAAGNKAPEETYLIAALPLYGQVDMSDDLLDPKQGYRLSTRLSPEISRHNGSQSIYLRSQIEGTYYQSMSDRIVLAARAKLGSIRGSSITNIAPSRRFYAGGGGSVRGYGYQAIGPSDSEGDPSGGRSLVEFSLEARIGTGFFDGALSVVPFVDAGAVDSSQTPTFSDIKVGAGLGIRYNTGFGPIRVDVGTPINPGPNDAPIGVYVAFGQAF